MITRWSDYRFKGGNHSEIKHYLNREPKNLPEFFIQLVDASRMTLFLFSSNRESPNKSKSFLTLSSIDSKILQYS